MKKVRKDKVRGYRVDFSSDTIYLTYSFAATAERDFLSPEAKRLREIKAAFPTMEVVVKAGRNITKTRPTKRLTYKNMGAYIRSLDNADKLLIEFEDVKQKSKAAPSPYKRVRDWFEAKFPNYKEASFFAEKDNVTEMPTSDAEIPA